jgi:hypothetical protein
VFYAQLEPPVRALLDARLARDYRLFRRYPAHGIHGLYPFERFVMNGAASAELYELVEDGGHQGRAARVAPSLPGPRMPLARPPAPPTVARRSRGRRSAPTDGRQPPRSRGRRRAREDLHEHSRAGATAAARDHSLPDAAKA